MMAVVYLFSLSLAGLEPAESILEIGAEPVSVISKYGDTHHYQVSIPGDALIRVRVERSGLDLKITAQGKDNSRNLRSGTPGAGNDDIWLTGETQFTLKVESLQSHSGGGRYSIRAEAIEMNEPGAAGYYFPMQDASKTGETIQDSAALDFWRRQKFPDSEANTLLHIINRRATDQSSQEALDFLLTRNHHRQQIFSDHWRAYLTFKEAEYNDWLGEIERAENIYRQALDLAIAADYPTLAGMIGNNMGYMFFYDGRVYEAQKAFELALTFYEHAPFEARLARVLINRARVHSFVGHTKEAREDLNRALNLAYKLDNQQEEALALLELGWACHLENRFDEATAHYEKAMTIREKQGRRWALAALRDRMGTALRMGGNLDAALASYQKAFHFFKEKKEHLSAAHVEINIGKVLAQQGKWVEADNICKKVLPVFRKDQPSQMEDALLLAARVSRTLGRPNEALAFLNEAHAAVEDLYQKGKSRMIRRSMGHSRYLYLAAYVDLLVELNRTDEAFLLLDRARARILRERLPQRKQSAENRKKQNVLKENLIKSRTDQNQSLQTLLALDLMQPLELADPLPDLTLDQIKKTLLEDDNAVIWFFSLDEQSSRLWTLERNATRIYQLPGRETVNQVVRELVKVAEMSHRKTGQRLWRRKMADFVKIMEAPLKKLPPKKRLVIAGDGVLSYAPFAALPALTGNESSLEGPRLIEERSIVFVPSLSYAVLQRLKPKQIPSSSGSVAIFADAISGPGDDRMVNNGISAPQKNRFDHLPRLRYSAEEAHAIAGFAPTTSKIWSGFRANRQAFLDVDWSRYQILHFSCHGLIDPIPDLAGLVLSRYREDGKPVNGFLTTLDIVNMNLPMEIAVLSACRTALGEDKYGQGLWGFSGALMEAGCRRVVASGWNVPEKATAVFFEHFYESLLEKGLAPDEALRQAQIHMLRDTPWKAPFYWAAWQLQGDWQNLPR